MNGCQLTVMPATETPVIGGRNVTRYAGWVMSHGVGTIAIDLEAAGLPAFTQLIGDCTLEVQRGSPGSQVATSGVRGL